MFLKSAGLSIQGCGDTNMGWTYLQECEICNLLSCCSRLNEEVWSKHKNICFLITLEPTINKLANISVMQHLQIPEPVKTFSTWFIAMLMSQPMVPVLSKTNSELRSSGVLYNVVSYWRFGTKYRSHLQGSSSPKKLWPLKMGQIGCPATSVPKRRSQSRLPTSQKGQDFTPQRKPEIRQDKSSWNPPFLLFYNPF